MRNVHPVYNIKILMIKRELSKNPELQVSLNTYSTLRTFIAINESFGKYFLNLKYVIVYMLHTILYPFCILPIGRELGAIFAHFC